MSDRFFQCTCGQMLHADCAEGNISKLHPIIETFQQIGSTGLYRKVRRALPNSSSYVLSCPKCNLRIRADSLSRLPMLLEEAYKHHFLEKTNA